MVAAYVCLCACVYTSALVSWFSEDQRERCTHISTGSTDHFAEPGYNYVILHNPESCVGRISYLVLTKMHCYTLKPVWKHLCCITDLCYSTWLMYAQVYSLGSNCDSLLRVLVAVAIRPSQGKTVIHKPCAHISDQCLQR